LKKNPGFRIQNSAIFQWGILFLWLNDIAK
jgi:hypothetical protein